MYPSAHFVHFVNSEDFKEAIEGSIQESSNPSWFFSGYDCDSLAMESVTGFAEEFLAFFKNHSNAWLELRTKSTNLKVLEKFEPMENVVVAFSFTPDEISSQTEWKVPSLQARIKAMQKTAKLGWKVDQVFLKTMKKANEEKLKELTEQLEKAKESEVEVEILDARTAKADFYFLIGDKEKCVKAIDEIPVESMSTGTKIDAVLKHIRVGLFHMDKDILIYVLLILLVILNHG